MTDLYLHIELRDQYGQVHDRIASPVTDDVAYMGNRIAGEVQLGVFGGFSQTVEVLKRKVFRRKALAALAETLGMALADHLEDREGWHGERRQERVEAQHTRADRSIAALSAHEATPKEPRSEGPQRPSRPLHRVSEELREVRCPPLADTER